MSDSEFRISQKQRSPTKRQIDDRANWVILLPAGSSATGLDFPYLDVLRQRRRRERTADKPDTEPVVADLPNKRGSRVAFAFVDPSIRSFPLLTLARKLVGVHRKRRMSNLAVAVAGFDADRAERLAEAVVAAAASDNAGMPSFKKKQDGPGPVTRLDLYGVRVAHGFKRTLAESAGNQLARRLSILPSNKLTPGDYVKEVRKLARQHRWKFEFYDVAALKRKKAGAFLAVVQGSPRDDAGIVRLRYTPSGKVSNKKKLALVGKGICYDTGGVSLKPPRHMFGMHEDMQGSAVALGTFLALTRLKVDFPVECWLAIAMNHIGSRAFNPNDVVTASDGTSIEVVNTDAEGRMVLADTLIMASGEKPSLIIDYATLTGTCMVALGTSYSGVFTNHMEYLPRLTEAGSDSGERVWPFPMDEDYDKGLDSDIADVKQCAIDPFADHILAARFLQRFVKNEVPWIHVDLASSNNKGGLAHIPTDTTGFGVRYTLNLLLEQKILD